MNLQEIINALGRYRVIGHVAVGNKGGGAEPSYVTWRSLKAAELENFKRFDETESYSAGSLVVYREPTALSSSQAYSNASWIESQGWKPGDPDTEKEPNPWKLMVDPDQTPPYCDPKEKPPLHMPLDSKEKLLLEESWRLIDEMKLELQETAQISHSVLFPTSRETTQQETKFEQTHTPKHF